MIGRRASAVSSRHGYRGGMRGAGSVARLHSDRCGGELARALASVPAATPSLEPLDARNVTVIGGIAE